VQSIHGAVPENSKKAGALNFSRWFSTVCGFLAAKLRHSVQRRTNPKSPKHRASVTVRKPVKTLAKTHS
jgi:hypothetical protein